MQFSNKMHCVQFPFLKGFVFIFLLHQLCQCGANFCFKRHLTLDVQRNVQLEWMVDSAKNIVTFDLSGDANKVLGIGFSADGNLSKSDFVFSGTHENGTTYLLDATLQEDGESLSYRGDVQQDYNLLKSVRTGPNVRLQFSRRWNTSDIEDFQFSSNLAHLLWVDVASLETASAKDFKMFKLYLLDRSSIPDPKSQDSIKNKPLRSWKLGRNMKIPNKTTSYWCTIHKAKMTMKQKHHAVGFKTILENEVARRHTHHIVLYQCNPADNVKATFDQFVNEEGEECYYTKRHKLPVSSCRTFMYTWAYGGVDFFLPDYAGFPIGESGDEYYLLETHYDNPASLSNLEFEVGVEIFYTDELRKYDAGLFMAGYDISPSLIIPPKSEDALISGHCAMKSQKPILTNEIDIFGVLLHSHMSGRRMRLNHIQENKSMSAIIYDDNYDFAFQQTRLLNNKRKIFNGDHLIMQCHYNTKWKNGTTFGGFSTSDEMCLAFIWYYPKISNLNECTSGIPFESTLKQFGIEKVKLDSSKQVWEWVVTKPGNLANRSLQDVLDNNVTWNDENRHKIAGLYYKTCQTDSC